MDTLLLTLMLLLSGHFRLCYVQGYLSNTETQYYYDLESNCPVRFAPMRPDGRVSMELYGTLYTFRIPDEAGINTKFWYNFGLARAYLNGKDSITVSWGPKEPI